MEKRLKADPDDWQAKRFFEKKKNRGKNKKCSYCDTSGHSRPTCKELKYAKVTAASLCREWRKKLVETLKVAGVGVGALVEYTMWGETKLGIVSAIEWNSLDHRIALGRGNPTALLVKPVNDLTSYSGRHLQIPITRELFDETHYNYYSEQSPKIVGPIDSGIVERQVPASFLDGQSCLELIFKDDSPTKERPSHWELNEWCSLQGFYNESED